MQIVNDSLTKREYYSFYKSNVVGDKIEYRSYIWDGSIEKYMPYDKFEVVLRSNETWEEFKDRKKKYGFIETEKCIPVRK